MKKILIVCQHFWPENFRLNDIAKGFLENGYSVDVLCGIPNYPLGEWFSGYGYFTKRHEIYEGINVFRVTEIKRKGNSNLRIFLNYLSFPFFSLFHIPQLMNRNYDKIFLYQLSPVMMSIAGILLGKIKKIQTIMYVLDLWPENLFSVLEVKNSFLRKIVFSISHWHYRHVDKLIGISSKMCSVLESINSKVPILELPQFCEDIYSNPLFDQELNNRFSEYFNIVYTGNISPAQNMSILVNTADILRSKYNITNIHWIIVGDGMSRKRLEKEVCDSNLNDFFSFEGIQPLDTIPKYTYTANCLIATLAKEDKLDCTIPAKVISYFAAGKPIILSMDGEASQLVNNTQSGFGVEAGNPNLLADRIHQLYSLSPKEREQKGINSKNVYLKYFSRNENMKRLCTFIES